jgi:hypothetical protein
MLNRGVAALNQQKTCLIREFCGIRALLAESCARDLCGTEQAKQAKEGEPKKANRKASVVRAPRPSLVTASAMSPFNGTFRETKKGAPVAACALTNVAWSQEKERSQVE